MPAERWRDLTHDPTLTRALAAAGPRDDAVRPRDRGAWSVRFARTWCAEIGEAAARDRAFRTLEVVPRREIADREPLARYGGHQRRRLGVIAATLETGPRLVMSMKSDHFASRNGRHGRAVPARLHELHDEARAVHTITPQALFVGVVLLPLSATAARSGASVFARTVMRLRALTGRLDRAAVTQFGQLDWSVVGLYAADDGGDVGPGVVRYIDTAQPPPRSGRPRLDTTMGEGEFLWRISEWMQSDGHVSVYADAESDD